MKKVLLVVTLVLGTLVSNAQLKEVTHLKVLGKVDRVGTEVVSIEFGTKGNYILSYHDSYYFIMYNAYRINTIEFTADDVELTTIIDMFKTQCKAEKGSEKEFGLGDNIFKIETQRAFGRSGLKVWVTGADHKTGYFSLLESDIDKLFGK